MVCPLDEGGHGDLQIGSMACMVKVVRRWQCGMAKPISMEGGDLRGYIPK